MHTDDRIKKTGRPELSEGKYWEIKVKTWQTRSIHMNVHGQPWYSLAGVRTGVVRGGLTAPRSCHKS